MLDVNRFSSLEIGLNPYSIQTQPSRHGPVHFCLFLEHKPSASVLETAAGNLVMSLHFN